MFIREKLFLFKMNQKRNPDENLDEFKKLINAFNQTREKLGAKSEGVILIILIHDTYKEMKIALKTKKQGTCIEDKKQNFKWSRIFILKGKNSFRKNNKNLRSSRDKSMLKCFLCHKEEHFKRNYPKGEKL